MKRYLLLTALFVIMIVALTLGNIPQPEEVGAMATPGELARADEIIAYGIYAHQYYADNVTAQTYETGNTTQNLEWVDNYNFLKGLLDRAYK